MKTIRICIGRHDATIPQTIGRQLQDLGITATDVHTAGFANKLPRGLLSLTLSSF